ncbi:MAG: OTU domain-containing protein [Gammaproteobacteria bacterium]
MITNAYTYYVTFYACYHFAYEDLIRLSTHEKKREPLIEKKMGITSNDLLVMLLEWSGIVLAIEEIAKETLVEKYNDFDACFSKINGIIESMVVEVTNESSPPKDALSYFQELQQPLSNSAKAIRKIKDKPNKKTYHPIQADGNCFFRAVSHQISLLKGDIKHHSALRTLAAETIGKNSTMFAPYIGNDKRSVDAYISTIKKPGEWADEPEIKSLAMALGMQIVVMDVSRGKITTYGDDNQGTIYLRYTCDTMAKVAGEHGHYDSIIDHQEEMKRSGLVTSVPFEKKWTPSRDEQTSPKSALSDTTGKSSSSKKQVSFKLPQ